MKTRPRRPLDRRDERGLALLDVLLGMAIFALIAVIAVQAMGTFRERAYVTQVSSDAKQLGVGIEAGRIGTSTYPASVDASASTVAGVNLTGDNEVSGYATAGDTFSVCVVKKQAGAVVAHAIYDSAGGALTSVGRGTGPSLCSAPPPPPALVNGVACPNITWATPFVWNATTYRVRANYSDPTISRITMIGGTATYIDQFAANRHDFPRATGVNWVNATMTVRGTNGLYRYDCTTSFTWPPD